MGVDRATGRRDTVLAATDLRLAKLTADTLRALMGQVPTVDETIRRVAASGWR